MQQWMGWLVSVLGHPIELIYILSDLIHILPGRCIHPHISQSPYKKAKSKQQAQYIVEWLNGAL